MPAGGRAAGTQPETSEDLLKLINTRTHTHTHTCAHAHAHLHFIRFSHSSAPQVMTPIGHPPVGVSPHLSKLQQPSNLPQGIQVPFQQVNVSIT